MPDLILHHYPMSPFSEKIRAVLGWLDRMAALGHGQMSRLTAAEAIAACAGAPVATEVKDDYFQDDHGIALGSRVSISAESFGAEPTVGELVAATRTRYTLRRLDARAGEVQVHFPRIGYAFKQEVTP